MTTAEKDGGQHEPRRSVALCPICKQPRSERYRPFCSKRCADVDLGRWLNGSYAIPVTEDDDEDGEEDRPASEKPDDSAS
jgi:endogenous inhibitor of DNA gyrase (YacG/DUF329 family)